MISDIFNMIRIAGCCVVLTLALLDSKCVKRLLGKDTDDRVY